jgi:recombination associated protein RdgC
VFKNLLLYRLGAEWSATIDDVNTALDKGRFAACGTTQPASAGWVEPRGEAHAPLCEVVDGQWLLRLMVERKVVPGSVVKQRIDELAERIEQQTGRAPGKKQKKELKDQALLELLPMAFAKRGSVGVWISRPERLLAIDAGSAGMADEVLTLLAQALPGFSATAVNTAVNPATAMADWLLSGEPPANFTVDRDCELKATDGEKPVVRYARHPLDIDEIRAHIAAGKRPTRLALTWNDRVSFVLTEGMQVKKLAFLDGVYEGRVAQKGENFEADAAIATGELAPLVGELIDALGGEQVIGAPAPVPGGAALALPTSATVAPASPAPASTATDLPPWESAAA